MSKNVKINHLYDNKIISGIISIPRNERIKFHFEKKKMRIYSILSEFSRLSIIRYRFLYKRNI